MSKKIDPTGFSKEIWGIVLDYTATSTREAIVYKVHHLPQKGPVPERFVLCHFNYKYLAETFARYSDFGQCYGLTKTEEQIRAFAVRTFIIGKVGSHKLNLRAKVIETMNRPSGLGLIEGEDDAIPILLELFLRLGLVEEKTEDITRNFLPLTHPDEPKDPVRLEMSDITLHI